MNARKTLTFDSNKEIEILLCALKHYYDYQYDISEFIRWDNHLQSIRELFRKVEDLLNQ